MPTIIDREQAIRELADHSGVSDEQTLDDLLEASTAEIEGFLNKHVVTPGTITEYHELHDYTSEIYLRQWPVIAVTSVHEDTNREYGATTLLTEGTDYIVDAAPGRLIRVSGASKTSWSTGFEAIKVVYSGGYATQAAVPADLKKISREHVVMMLREIENRDQNLESVQDAFGNFRRFGPVMLTSGMKSRLRRHRSISLGGQTWTRWEVA